MKIVLRLLLIVFCFLLCSCTSILFSNVLKPENEVIIKDLSVGDVEQHTGFGITGIIVPFAPIWVSRNTFRVEIQLQNQDTTSRECPVLVLSQGNFKGYYQDSEKTSTCTYSSLPEEGNMVDGKVTMGVEWKNEIYPLTLSESVKFRVKLMPEF